jgi:hypothetical protein
MPLTVKEFQHKLSSAHWRMGLAEFCRLLEWQEDDYAMDKFREFSNLAHSLDQFDATTLAKLIGEPE